MSYTVICYDGIVEFCVNSVAIHLNRMSFVMVVHLSLVPFAMAVELGFVKVLMSV